MIDKSTIEEKDFRIPLLTTAIKIKAIAFLLDGVASTPPSGIEDQHLTGIGAILEDVVADLEAIHEGLYDNE